MVLAYLLRTRAKGSEQRRGRGGVRVGYGWGVQVGVRVGYRWGYGWGTGGVRVGYRWGTGGGTGGVRVGYGWGTGGGTGGVQVGYGPTCYGLDAGGTEVILCQQSGHVTLLKQMVLQIGIDKLHCEMSR